MKKLICLAVVMPLVVAVCSGQMKYYSDWQGHSGYAVAEYCTTHDPSVFNKQSFLDDRFRESLDDLAEGVKSLGYAKSGDIKKLSKQENFLIWSALNEYELLDGEVYKVVTYSSDSTDPYRQAFFVCIMNNGKSFKWGGIEIRVK